MDMEVEMQEEFRSYRNSQYEVSDKGRVFATDYHGSGQRKELAYVDDGYGYYHVCIHIDGKQLTPTVHSMVCECFLGERNGRSINHKDEDKHNNAVDNLEYCTVAHNNCHGTRIERVSKALRNSPKLSRPCSQYTMSGELVRSFPSVKEAERQTGFHNVWSSCTGQYNQCGGFVWRFGNAEHVDVVIENHRLNNSLSTKVGQFDKSGNLLRVFPSMNEAGRVLGMPVPNIVDCCKGRRKTARGFVWRYV